VWCDRCGQVKYRITEEFVAAGDFLAYKFGVWSWSVSIVDIHRQSILITIILLGKKETRPKLENISHQTNNTFSRVASPASGVQLPLHTQMQMKMPNVYSTLAIHQPQMKLMNGSRRTLGENIR
jgi:3'-phosphoadenosine 5'-phosphosulfate sulfotransferase